MSKLYWKEYLESNRQKIYEYQRDLAKAAMTAPEKLLCAQKYRQEYYKAKRDYRKLSTSQPTSSFRIIREKRVITISLS
jgi:hypothetical protein